MKKKHNYILGTGLSHDGSACLLKDGRICVAIEKERLSRVKHDGGNDTLAVAYCLNAEGIKVEDLSLIVQNSNFDNFDFGNTFFDGPRIFSPDLQVPVVSISHHLAHAYSAAGLSPFDQCNIMVLDGCGSSIDDCIDLEGTYIPDRDKLTSEVDNLYFEKDSFYSFSNGSLKCLYKDFSEFGYTLKNYPMHPTSTKHSIGGLYSAVSKYCFGRVDDVGKLMGLSPYGRKGVYDTPVFDFTDGRVFLKYDWMRKFGSPALTYQQFKQNFQYYADIARWIQDEIEKAIEYLFVERLKRFPGERICYTGGVALNALANATLKKLPGIKDLFITPAAGDNGLSVGCCYYGWLHVQKNEKIEPTRSSCYGVKYSNSSIERSIEDFGQQYSNGVKEFVETFISCIAPEDSSNKNSSQHSHYLDVHPMGIYKIPDSVVNGVYEGGVIKVDAVVLFNWINGAGFPAISGLKCTGSSSAIDGFERFLQRFDWSAAKRNLKKKILHHVRSTDVTRDAAQLLSEGKIIGWFQDGCEFGPRALGRRSILADPRKPGARDFINGRIKFREDFRPFAPSVLAEDASRFFINGWESPYMILVDGIRPEWKQELHNVVHQNDTSRVQTVTPEDHEKYYSLLQRFKELTGIGILLNTSFNRRGMPIVETPSDALDFFFNCELDVLVMGDYIVTAEVSDPGQEIRSPDRKETEIGLR